MIHFVRIIKIKIKIIKTIIKRKIDQGLTYARCNFSILVKDPLAIFAL